MNDMSETTYINYQFIFKDGREEYFPITLRLSDLSLLSQSPPTQPSWTELTFNQCENCPLSLRTSNDFKQDKLFSTQIKKYMPSVFQRSINFFVSDYRGK